MFEAPNGVELFCFEEKLSDEDVSAKLEELGYERVTDMGLIMDYLDFVWPRRAGVEAPDVILTGVFRTTEDGGRSVGYILRSRDKMTYTFHLLDDVGPWTERWHFLVRRK